jgi:Ca2+-binding RTX toxin-like protein
MMKPAIILKIALIGLFALAVVSVASAFAASNSIAPSNIGIQSEDVNADDLKPDACAALHLTNVVGGAGTITGTSNNDLIVGSDGKDIIDGKGGDDCIIGAGGDDSLNGNSGSDICIGGEGNNTYLNCETIVP